MSDLLRDTAFGHLVRFVFSNRFLQYLEERDDSLSTPYYPSEKEEGHKQREYERTRKGTRYSPSRSPETLEEYKDADVVGWWNSQDSENPRNWPQLKKAWVAFQVGYLTFAVLIAGSIYSSGVKEVSTITFSPPVALAEFVRIQERFHVGKVASVLGLTTYVAGNGIGVMILSPLTDIPRVGRTTVYLGTLVIFVACQAPIALAVNFGMLLAFRFLAGLAGSLPLAVAGASFSDMYPSSKRSYPMLWWNMACLCAPTLGPVVGGFAVQGKDWTWTAWVTMWHAAFVLIVLFCFLPETSSHHILYRRTRRLRKLTGNDRLTCHDELEHADNPWKDLAVRTLITPFTLNTEPIVFSINLYVGLVYALLYTWLESFEIVFGEKYGMGLGEESLTFLGIFVGGLVSLPPLIWHSRHHLEPEYSEEDEIEPEKLLGPAKVGGFFIPACLFIFGWTAQYKAPWIAPVIGSGLFGVANNMILNSIVTYLPHVYPRYSASVLAGNEFTRSALAAGFPLFAGPMYRNLGIAWASTLLALLGCVFVPLPFLLARYGKKLRMHSARATHDL